MSRSRRDDACGLFIFSRIRSATPTIRNFKERALRVHASAEREYYPILCKILRRNVAELKILTKFAAERIRTRDEGCNQTVNLFLNPLLTIA